MSWCRQGDKPLSEPMMFSLLMHICITPLQWVNWIHNNLIYCVPGIRFLRFFLYSLQWRHNERDGVSNDQPHDCLLNRLFRHEWKKTSKVCVTGLCAGNSPVTCESPVQRASNAENVSIWWRHHMAVAKFLKSGKTLTFIDGFSKLLYISRYMSCLWYVWLVNRYCTWRQRILTGFWLGWMT